MEVKKDIMWRITLSFLFISLLGIAILVQICRIQFVQGSYWRNKADSLNLHYMMIGASRGNIFSSDGNLLATSVPIYDIRVDAKADGLTNDVFAAGIDSLSIGLAELFTDHSAADFKRELREARAGGDRYFLLRRNVTYTQLQKLKKLPLFRLGRYKGGLMIEQKNMRELPFRELASRTIGTVRDVKPVGIEASFDSTLNGESGQRLMQRISGNVWMPVGDKDEIEPKDGNDVLTTIDVNIQDVAEHSLMEHLMAHNADHGCAVLMEVATGEIKAIANLSRTKDGSYSENFNYAVAEGTEPGSTMKMASLLAAMDDGLVEPTDTVDVGYGFCSFFGQPMKDSHAPIHSRMSVQEVFEHSSNVGVSKVIFDRYRKNPEAFISKLKKFHLDRPLGLQIAGEGMPRIKDVHDKDFSPVSLPWMSIGYEVTITPLQMLSFYNAVANNGRMVRPMLVKEIRDHGKLVRKFSTEIIADSIASPSALAKARTMMEGVVQRGTASSLKSSPYKIAGKTGTAQMHNNKYGYDVAHRTYQASFAGYFPADNPKYSCIVVVYAPGDDVYFGGAVAAPIFKEIADKVFSNHLEMHDHIPDSVPPQIGLPLTKSGSRKDLIRVMNGLSLPLQSTADDAQWVSVSQDNGNLIVSERKMFSGIVPNVIGMGLRDAIYILENAGFIVRANGKGFVNRQSVEAGKKVVKGQVIVLELS